MSKKKNPMTSDQSDSVVSYKGFNRDWTCRGYQFEVGKSYEMDGKIEACSRGFHACEHPLNVFDYYPPSLSRFAEVTQSGSLARHDDDTKIASAKITINCELSIGELVKRAVKYVFDRAKPEDESATGNRGAASATGIHGAASATGNQGAASATGNQGAASATGNQGAASATGDRGAASATGNQGAASATGYQGAASATGDRGAASATGYHGAASATGIHGAASATGIHGAASATGNQGAASATGNRGAASATGNHGAASATGYQGAASATGNQGAAMASGYDGRVAGKTGNALFAVERNENYEIISVACGIVGREGIKEGVQYVCKGDRLVEAAS